MPGERGAENLVPTYGVLVNGAEMPPAAAADLLSVAIEDDVEAPGMFELRLVNWDMDRLAVSWADDDLFAEGNEVAVRMGYVDRLETLIVGEVTGLEPEFRAEDVPLLTVRGYDRRHRLIRGRRSRTFTQAKDSDVAREIAGDAGLKAEVEDTGVVHEHLLQDNQTDLGFLEARARRIGYEVVVDDRTLHFRRRQNSASEVLRLDRTGDLLEFYPRLSTLGQADKVTVTGWSPKDKAAVVGEAGAGDEGTRMDGAASGPEAAASAFGSHAVVSVDERVASQAEADQVAQGRLREIALGYVRGDGVVRGRTDLRAGTVIRVEGVGRRFSGLYYVVSTRHTYSAESGYRTAFTVRRNAT